MDKTSDFLRVIVANIKALSYTYSNEVFDFETVPSSNLGNCYRFTAVTESIDEHTGCVQKNKAATFWFAYAMKSSKDDVEEELFDIYDLQEDVEDELLNSLNVDSNITTTLTSEFVDDFLIIQVGFGFSYERSLS